MVNLIVVNKSLCIECGHQELCLKKIAVFFFSSAYSYHITIARPEWVAFDPVLYINTVHQMGTLYPVKYPTGEGYLSCGFPFLILAHL